jgi:hypothetical protein
VFDIELTRSQRGEFEITDYVTTLAARRAVRVVRARTWLPIGNVEAWQRAQHEDLEAVLTRRS